ncbi:C3a anaphylatoxin chemotactic receptor-like isoform 2-T2 [Anomaloglossus baeobatrachus]|uniref:C3a anaphylatoxin chemotactic receptor-like isoform X2 n=1 Tax=Anomaloglossus baeobatrachus TaxID=238106 RepID=UPI003F4F5D88
MDSGDNDLTKSNTNLNFEKRSPNNNNFHDYDNIVQKTLITIFSIVFALGIIGNGFVIWIAGFRMKNTISAVWFLHLAIADFLCCASLPMRIIEWVAYHTHTTHFVHCILNIFLLNINMTSSVLLLTAMSIDRWVSVMWPFWAKVHRTCNVVRICAAIIWGLSLIVAGLVFYSYRYGATYHSELCVFYYYSNLYNPDLHHIILLIRFVTMFVFPFLIIVTFYVTTFCKLRKSKRPQRSERSSRIITAVILCFFICWLPYYIFPLITRYYVHVLLTPILHTIVIILACLNSCMKPIIYVYMGPGFRQGFFRSIPVRVERALSEHPNDLCREEDGGNIRSTEV